MPVSRKLVVDIGRVIEEELELLAELAEFKRDIPAERARRFDELLRGIAQKSYDAGKMVREYAV